MQTRAPRLDSGFRRNDWDDEALAKKEAGAIRESPLWKLTLFLQGRALRR